MPTNKILSSELLIKIRAFLLDTNHPHSEYLRTGEFTASDVKLSLEAPTGTAPQIGQQLQILTEEGLLTRKRVGGSWFYRLA